MAVDLEQGLVQTCTVGGPPAQFGVQQQGNFDVSVPGLLELPMNGPGIYLNNCNVTINIQK